MAISIHFASPWRYLPVGLGGALFAFLPWKILNLDFRYAIAVTGGLVCLTLALIFIRQLDDILVYALIFNIPFAIFGKWLLVQEVVVPAKGIALGLFELLLLIAYVSWFAQIFISRACPLPKLRGIDLLVFLLLTINAVSLASAEDKLLGALDVIYTCKHMLIYFFLANKVRSQHLRWIIALFVFAIFIESAVAIYERTSGHVNIASTKGNVESADFGVQYRVPGIEDELRAAGTTNDSHSLGLYYAMILPMALIMLASSQLSGVLRMLPGLALAVGLVGLVITFSRSGWLGFAVAALLASWVIVFRWKQGKVLGILLLVVVAASSLYPQAYGFIYRRLFEAPATIMESRYEMNYSALDIWRNHPFLGAGPGNYIAALDHPEVRTSQAITDFDLPVHNIYLYTLAELGFFGSFVFLAIVVIALCYCWGAIKHEKDSYARSLALATLAGIAGYLVNGLTDPMFREAVPYAQFWTFIALATVVHRISRQSGDTQSAVAVPQRGGTAA